MKKRIVLSVFSVLLLFIITGCKEQEVKTNEKEEAEAIFSEEDFTKATKMVDFMKDKTAEFQSKATNSIKSGEIKLSDEGKLKESLNKMAESIVLKPFLEEYPNSLVSEKIVVSFEITSSEPCPMGNCKYDGVAVPTINYEESNNSVYTSNEFQVSQLIYEDVTSKFDTTDDSEIEKAYLRFLKSESGDLIMSSSPFILNESIYVDEWDQEFDSIKSDVPESEIKVEEEEFRKKVEEVLAKYPPLQ
ncbi:hypothetical protein [Psychrobacillus sp. NPDC096623]|uniref:hypothetical protein n=1 Tax=Psychrobacillus sp. NPDC096623 TaxID=3364492 RepID=UPI003814C709